MRVRACTFSLHYASAESCCLSASCVAALLLNGVTFDSEGDSALHVVAAAGDSKDYLKCAEIIHDKAKHLLQEINKKGDTPVHCAARAGNCNMVSCLIEMAVGENDGAVRHELLRKRNKIGGTARIWCPMA